MSANSTRSDAGETIQVGALGVRFLVEAADSDRSLSVFEGVVPADDRMTAPHSHDRFEESVYGLEGVTSWTVDGVPWRSGSATPDPARLGGAMRRHGLTPAPRS